MRAAPEGNGCIFTLTRSSRTGSDYRTSLWLYRPGSLRRLVDPRSRVTSARWSPDGTQVAFIGDGREASQVFLVAAEGGTPTPLGGEAQWTAIVDWSRDGRELLLLQRRPWAEDAMDDPASGDDRPRVADFLPYKKDGGGWSVGERVRLVALSRIDGRQRTLVEGDFDVSQACWSHDGRQLAWIRSRGGQQRHLTDLWISDADGRHAHQATRSLAGVNSLAWSPDGRRIALAASALEGDSISELWLVPSQGGLPARAVATSLHLEGNTLCWHPDSRRIAVVAAIGGLFRLVVVDTTDEVAVPLDTGLSHVLSMHAGADAIFFVSASMRRPCELRRTGWDGHRVLRLSRFNRGWAAQRRWPRVRKCVFRVRDGDGIVGPVDAWLLTPADVPPPYPLYMDLHGGPQSIALIDYAEHGHWYDLVERGWAVVAPNAAGSASYGDDYARRLRGRWGELDLPQHLSLIDALRSRGLASGIVACGGKSYGGFLAAYALAHSDAFDAIVVSAPVANIKSHSGTSDSGYYVTPYAMRGELDQARGRWRALSPTECCTSAPPSGIEAPRAEPPPVLMLQGERDQRCPLGQSEELFAQLVRCGCPARMVVYPGGSHSMASSGKPSHRIDYRRRFVAWVHEATRRAGSGA